jgi:hypothetical protein
MLRRSHATALIPSYLTKSADALAMAENIDLLRLSHDIIAANPQYATITPDVLSRRLHMDFHLQQGYPYHSIHDGEPNDAMVAYVNTGIFPSTHLRESMFKSKIQHLQDLKHAFGIIAEFLSHEPPASFYVAATWSCRRFFYFFWGQQIKSLCPMLYYKFCGKLPVSHVPIAFLQLCDGDAYLDMLPDFSMNYIDSVYRTENGVSWTGPVYAKKPLLVLPEIDDSDKESDASDAEYQLSGDEEEDCDEEYKGHKKRKLANGQPKPVSQGRRGRPSMLSHLGSIKALIYQILQDHGSILIVTPILTTEMVKTSLEKITPLLIAHGESVDALEKIGTLNVYHYVVTHFFKISQLSKELKAALLKAPMNLETDESKINSINNIRRYVPEELKDELDTKCYYILRFAMPTLLNRLALAKS